MSVRRSNKAARGASVRSLTGDRAVAAGDRRSELRGWSLQAWGNRVPTTKYRDMLLDTATEEIGHIEMLALAVALNLAKAPTHL